MIYDFNPYDFFTNFNRTAVEKCKEELTIELQKIDDELFQYIRKANPTYKPKGYWKRKLISIFGEIQLNLHRYNIEIVKNIIQKQKNMVNDDIQYYFYNILNLKNIND